MKRAVVICALSAFLPLLAFAQSGTSTSTQPILVATVNIYDAKIVSQQGNLFSVSFDLSNRQNAQPDVRYAVELLDSQQNVADEMVYPAVLNLTANSDNKITVQYTAPGYLSGAYQLAVVSQNSNGLPLAQVIVGNVTLSGSGSAVEILPSSCTLSIPGAKTKQTYTIAQGVDIAASETLELTCSVQNNSSSALTLTPTFQTTYRSSFGAPVQTSLPQSEQISIGAGKTQSVTLQLPKATDPQSYDVQVSFTNTGNVPSNSITVHYVLDGASATIQNLTLDNTSYSAGQTAQATLFWTGAANNFPDARVAPVSLSGAKASIHMVDASGNSCGPDVSAALNATQPQQVIPFPMNVSCVSPVVGVTLTDSSGTVLATSTFTFTAPVQPAGQLNDIWILLIALVILLLGGYIVLKIHKGAGHTQALVLLVLLSSSASALGALPQRANADTYTQNVYVVSSGGWEGWYPVNFTVNLDNSTYAPGATITAYGSAQVGTCANSLYAGVQATINGQTQQVYTISISGLNGQEPVYQVDTSSNTFTAPSAPGSYNASFFYELSVPNEGAGSGSYFCMPSGTPGASANPSIANTTSNYACIQGDEGSEGCQTGQLQAEGLEGWCQQYGSGPYSDGMTSFTAQQPYNIPYTVVGQCPDGSAPANNDPSQCTCAQGNTTACDEPTASVTANGKHQLAIPLGSSYTLAWSSTSASSCTLAWQGSGPQYSGTNGSRGETPDTSDSGPSGLIGTYTFTCLGLNGQTVSDSAIVNTNTCADGSAAPNGDPSQCPCSSNSQCSPGLMCSQTTGECNGGGGGTGGICSAGSVLENGSCVNGCSEGYTQEGDKCIFISCPVGYSQRSDASGNPECSFGSCPQGDVKGTDANGNPECASTSCSIGYVCNDGSLYTQNASCSLTFDQACAYGCTGSAGFASCNPPPSPILATWSVTPVLLKSAQTTSINWLAQNVASCSISGSNEDGTSQSSDPTSPGLWSDLTGTKTSSPILGQTTYTITCLALQGATPTSVSSSTVVNVVPTFQEN